MKNKQIISLLSAAAVITSSFGAVRVRAENMLPAEENAAVDITLAEAAESTEPEAAESVGSEAAESTGPETAESAEPETAEAELNEAAEEADNQVNEQVSGTWSEYTAVYDHNGRLTAIYKTDNIDPAAVDGTADFKQLKTFVWNEKNEPYAAQNTVVFDADSFKKIEPGDADTYQIEVYEALYSSQYSRYTLAGDPKMYVNGIQLDERYFRDVIEVFDGQYVRDNAIGSVKLTDVPDPETGITDGIYDVVDISYYVDGIVEGVDEKDGEVCIAFDIYDDDIDRGEVVLDDSRDCFIKLDGKEIAPGELMKGDVLSIAYDVNDRFRYSSVYNIYASRSKTSGKVINVFPDIDKFTNNEYTLDDGNVYKPAYEGCCKLAAGKTYDLWFDVAGRIAYAKEKLGVERFALLENVYLANGGGDAYADIIGNDGRKVSYQINMSDFDEFVNVLMSDPSMFDTSSRLENRRQPQERVISYTITAEGSLKIKERQQPKEFDGEYLAETNRLAGVKLSTEFTAILDLTDYIASESHSCKALNAKDLTENRNYAGCAFGSVDYTYQFVIITEGNREWSVNDPWAVYMKTSAIKTDNGINNAITVLTGGNITNLSVKDESILEGMTAGDVFFYRLNSNNEVTELKPVTKVGGSYPEYFENAVNNSFDVVDSNTVNDFRNSFAKDWGVSSDDCDIISGPIAKVLNDDVAIVTKAELGKSNQSLDRFSLDYVKNYLLADDVNVTVYDYTISKEHSRVKAGNAGMITGSGFYRDSYVGDKLDNIVNFNKELETTKAEEILNGGCVNFAVAKVVNNEIKDILIIVPSSEDIAAKVKKPSVQMSMEDYKGVMKYDDGIRELSMYTDKTQSRINLYTIAADAEYRVNGITVPDAQENFFDNAYVWENNTGTIKLEDTSADGKYDIVDISYYVDAVVREISAEPDGTTIVFDFYDVVFGQESFVIGSGKECSVSLDNESVNLADIKKGDVISVAFDVNKGVAASDKYEILVSRGAAESMVTHVYAAEDTCDDEYTLDNGNTYRQVFIDSDRLKAGSSYKLYFDAFGRIAYAEELLTTKCALLENVYTADNGTDIYAEIIGDDGLKKAYQIRCGDYNRFLGILMNDLSKVDTSEMLMNRKAPQDRVISYELTQSGELRCRDTLAARDFNGKFDPEAGVIGNVQLSAEKSSIINIAGYAMDKSRACGAVAYSDLKSDADYTGYAFGSIGEGRISRLVLLTSGMDNTSKPEIYTNKLGLLENVYLAHNGADAYADVMEADGVRRIYQVDTDQFDMLADILMADRSKMDTSEKFASRKEPQKRVISYALNSRNELSLTAAAAAEEISGVYDAEANTLCGISLDEQNTSIIDAAEYRMDKISGYPVVDAEILIPGQNYRGYSYSLADNDKTIRFVMITDGSRDWNVEMPMAVFMEKTMIETDEGIKDAIKLCTTGGMKYIQVNCDEAAYLDTGDVFFYRLNPNNEIYEIKRVAEVGDTYRDYYMKALSTDFNVIDPITKAEFKGDVFVKNSGINADECSLISGPIVNWNGKNEITLALTMANKDNIYFTLADGDKYKVSSDANVCVYDYSMSRKRDRVYRTSMYSIKKSEFEDTSYIGSKEDGVVSFMSEFETILADGDPNYGHVNFAVAKVINNEITEMLVIVPEYYPEA